LCPNPCTELQYCYTCEDNINDIAGGTDSSTHCWTAPSVFFVKVILPLMGATAAIGIVLILLQRIREELPKCTIPVCDGRAWSLIILWVVTTIVALADVHFWVMVHMGPPEQRPGFAVGGVFFIVFFLCVAICLGAMCVRNPQQQQVVVQAAPSSNNTIVVMGPPPGAQPGMIAMQPYPGYAQPVYVAQGVPPGAAMAYQPAPMGYQPSPAGYPPEGPAQGSATASGGGEGDVYA
jgi:hypothetical protein